MLSLSSSKRHHSKKTAGFTIVELLIVIVIIGILAAITIVAYNGIQTRARDAARQSDMASIKTALQRYNIDNGGVPATTTFSGAGPGGWNLSSMPSWLSFLDSATYGKIPVDPVNTGTADPGTYELTYFYYCYPAGSGQQPATANIVLGYWLESSHGQASTSIAVDQCK